MFRARQRDEALGFGGGSPGSVDWMESTPFSPAELRHRMQKQQLEPGVEYSWLPASPKTVRVRRSRAHTDQMHLDFGQPGNAEGGET